MADHYAVTGRNTVSTGSRTAAAIHNPGTTIRAFLYDYIISASGTPADNVLVWVGARFTTVGTEGSGVVPIALDGGPASIIDGAQGHSAEPGYTAASEFLDQGLNQRATFRWVAAPGGAIMIPAATSNGVGLATLHAAYTGNAEVTMHFEE